MPDAADVREYVSDEALTSVAEALRRRRDQILQNWIQRVGQEPFHLGRAERAVADHIPRLLDAVIDNLLAVTEGRERLGFREQELRHVASEHARGRLLEGLWVSEVITELRLLAQEISEELRAELADATAQVGETLGAELVVQDVVFGAAVIAAEVLSEAQRQQQNYAVSLIVHDLRTPLTSLKGFAQLLNRDPESERVAKAAAVMLNQISRLTGWIDDFLAASQVTIDIASLTVAATDLEDLVVQIVASMGDEARRRVKVSVEGSAETTGEWDKTKLDRVFENIIANALKYAPTGDIRVTLSSDGTHMYVRVHDQGIGITPEDRAKVFEPYYRSDDAIQHKIQGTGLGLFLAKGILEAHGGTLTLESAGVGQGSTVTIMLPRHGTGEMEQGPATD